jgi:hypothetical protein
MPSSDHGGPDLLVHCTSQRAATATHRITTKSASAAANRQRNPSGADKVPTTLLHNVGALVLVSHRVNINGPGGCLAAYGSEHAAVSCSKRHHPTQHRKVFHVAWEAPFPFPCFLFFSFLSFSSLLPLHHSQGEFPDTRGHRDQPRSALDQPAGGAGA